jgi:hypothetical protein
MMQLLENTDKVLAENDRLRLMLEKQKHPFSKIPVSAQDSMQSVGDVETEAAVGLQTSEAAQEGKQTQAQTVVAATAQITRTPAKRAQRSAPPPPAGLAAQKAPANKPALATKVLASRVLGPESLIGALGKGALSELGVTQVSPEQLRRQQVHQNMQKQAAHEVKDRHADTLKQADVLLPSTLAKALRDPLPPNQEKALRDPLPPDWEERVSKSKGRVYYYNHKTGENVWKLPSHTKMKNEDQIKENQAKAVHQRSEQEKKAQKPAVATHDSEHKNVEARDESPRLIGTYPQPPKTDLLPNVNEITTAQPAAIVNDITTAQPAVIKRAEESHVPQVLAARVMAPESVAVAYEAGMLSSRSGARTRVGLGIAVVRVDDNLKITRVVPGYAAAKSQQVLVGDGLEGIDGQSVADLDLTAIRRLLVGREGTKCALRISRDGIPFTVYLIREQPIDHAPHTQGGAGGHLPAYSLPQPLSERQDVDVAPASSGGRDGVGQSVIVMHRQVEGDATVYDSFAKMSPPPRAENERALASTPGNVNVSGLCGNRWRSAGLVVQSVALSRQKLFWYWLHCSSPSLT